MLVASGGLFSLAIPLLEPFRRPSAYTPLMASLGAVCFVLYHLFNGGRGSFGGLPALPDLHDLCADLGKEYFDRIRLVSALFIMAGMALIRIG